MLAENYSVAEECGVAEECYVAKELIVANEYNVAEECDVNKECREEGLFGMFNTGRRSTQILQEKYPHLGDGVHNVNMHTSQV